MWSPNTHRRRGGFLMVAAAAAVVMLASLAEVVAAPSYSPCIRPMDVKCDSKSTLSDKIIGGDIAEPGSTSWLVSLQDTQYGDPVHFCGGTLLSHTWVLTSASCVSSYQKDYANIQVVLGEYNMLETDGYERYRWVSQITIHPDYDYYTHHADVALIRLGFYVLYNERIDVLRLPTEEPMKDPCGEDGGCGGDIDNELYTIAGWGRVGESGEPSPVVRVAQIPLVNREECRKVYPDFTSTMICAGNLTYGGLDACQGDRGGALAATDGSIKGVSSWGVGCGQPGFPGVYTDVSLVVDWICSVTNTGISIPPDRLDSCRHDWTGSLAHVPLSSRDA